ncbi:unnamed protein product [Ixodes persulcatus]
MANGEPFDSDLCMLCNESLPDDGMFSKCCDCEYAYHLGACSGVSESTFKSRGENAKKTWRCPTCRTSKARGAQAHSKDKREPELDFGKLLLEMNNKLGDLVTIREKVDSLMSVKDTVSNIEKRVQELSDKYDQVLAQMKEQSKEISDLKKRVSNVETQSSTEEVKRLKLEVNSLEQYSRRQNLEIHGLPRSENENLRSKVNEIARKLELSELTENDLDGLHRLPPKPGKIPVILVRFLSRVTRDQWLAKWGGLRDTGLNVRFFDNLTASNKKLLWMTKTKAREQGYAFTWQKNGTVFVRKAQGQRAIKIESEDDLGKIM